MLISWLFNEWQIKENALELDDFGKQVWQSCTSVLVKAQKTVRAFLISADGGPASLPFPAQSPLHLFLPVRLPLYVPLRAEQSGSLQPFLCSCHIMPGSSSSQP